VSWLPFNIATACVSESLNIPATAVGNWEVGVMGVGKVLGREAPVMVRGHGFSNGGDVRGRAILVRA